MRTQIEINILEAENGWIFRGRLHDVATGKHKAPKVAIAASLAELFSVIETVTRQLRDTTDEE